MASRGGALVLIVLWSLLQLGAAKTKPLVPAMFVFGDSLVDVGNNNQLAKCNVTCQANYQPFGVDYPPCHSPTGRFSNGYNLADQLAQLLGFDESPPAFLSPSNASASRRTSTGINFASGGSGLLPTTGSQFVRARARACLLIDANTHPCVYPGSVLCVQCGEVFTMAEQVGNFTSLVRSSGRKDRTAADLVSESLIFISVGSNDLFEYADYITKANISSSNRNDTEYLQGLIASYTSYIKELYAAGATKFGVLSPSLVGCCPLQRALAKEFNGSDQFGCLGVANNLSQQLYPMIASMLQDLSMELPDMSYSLGDAIGMAGFVFKSTRDFGENVCNSSAPLCQNRSSFFFWDRFHPTDAVSAITANELFQGPAGRFVHPINVHQLMAPQP
ncbi:hypothetical protein HU200_060704 [Digitaria exilis]|uniref:GDSL esterase/lipase n=1 Tax=Digitaria exilis TaxID=1010633 RepID=A0A835AAB5_9POAL|nr:hypothetical protein HU200_060704 [Digitaria exilis]